MNLQEFAALKVGDRVNNFMHDSAQGIVTETSNAGVKVRWCEGGLPFFFGVQGTAWFHWSKAEAPQERNPANCEHGVAMDIFCELCEPAK